VKASTDRGQSSRGTPPADPGAGLLEDDLEASWLRPLGHAGEVHLDEPKAQTALRSAPSEDSPRASIGALVGPRRLGPRTNPSQPFCTQTWQPLQDAHVKLTLQLLPAPSILPRYFPRGSPPSPRAPSSSPFPHSSPHYLSAHATVPWPAGSASPLSIPFGRFPPGRLL